MRLLLMAKRRGIWQVYTGRTGHGTAKRYVSRLSTGTEVSPDVGFQNCLSGKALVSGMSPRCDQAGPSPADGRGVWAPVTA